MCVRYRGEAWERWGLRVPCKSAIQRERNMKHWKRAWKTALVDAMNPEWDDLTPTLI